MTHENDPIWITGLGVCCPLGNDFETVGTALLNGQSAVQNIKSFDTSHHPTRIASFLEEIPCPPMTNLEQFFFRPKSEQLFLFCMAEALKMAGLTENLGNHRLGLAMGIGPEWLHAWERDFHANGMAINLVGREVRPPWAYGKELLGVSGPSLQLSTACASGNHTLIFASHWLKMGLVDICIAGSCAQNATPITLASFGNLRALSRRNDDPKKASRPFDRNRDGFVIGDGGVLFVLERKSSALKRGVKPLAEFLGGGNTSDAHHLVIPNPEAIFAKKAIRKALANSKINPEDIDYINAHGTSTLIGDIGETKAIQNAFGHLAARIPVSSTKSMTGHLLAASSAIEALASITAISKQAIPPTINLEDPDPQCNLNHVANQAIEKKVNYVLSNSFGFGGSNSCVVLGKAS